MEFVSFRSAKICPVLNYINAPIVIENRRGVRDGESDSRSWKLQIRITRDRI